ncbi:MAG: hypothetical protein AAGI08_01030 [Bacteroidota bacterium]
MADLFFDPVLALGLTVLVKTVLLTLLAVLNALLSLLASIAIWKSYLAAGIKVFITALVLIPVVGLVIYLFWGQRKVREAQT